MVSIFRTRVRVSNIPQPDAVTCQSTCLAMAFGDKGESVYVIRQALLEIGPAGDPQVMATYARQRINSSRPDLRYRLELDASLHDCVEWIQNGEFLIVHGWFTRSGHVICLDAVEADLRTGSIRFSVKDPWGEFDFPRWRYYTHSNFYDGFYSAFGLYAACVAGQSVEHARRLYHQRKLDTRQRGAWVHRFARANG